MISAELPYLASFLSRAYPALRKAPGPPASTIKDERCEYVQTAPEQSGPLKPRPHRDYLGRFRPGDTDLCDYEFARYREAALPYQRPAPRSFSCQETLSFEFR